MAVSVSVPRHLSPGEVIIGLPYALQRMEISQSSAVMGGVVLLVRSAVESRCVLHLHISTSEIPTTCVRLLARSASFDFTFVQRSHAIPDLSPAGSQLGRRKGIPAVVQTFCDQLKVNFESFADVRSESTTTASPGRQYQE